MTQPLQVSPASSPAIAAFDGPQGWRQGLAYGLMGLPLAFVALPLYVIWPNHYAREMGVSLSALGLLLLAVRLGDALIDPWLGRVLDQYGRTKEKYQKTIGHLSLWGSLLLLGSVYALFAPPAGLRGSPIGLLAWAGVGLVGASLSYSALTIAHHAWAARLGGDTRQRSRVVAWRESAALVGVIMASVLPSMAGWPALVTGLALSLLIGVVLWSKAVVPDAPTLTNPSPLLCASPWQQAQFRRLIAIFVVNGFASAIPASLVLFFVQDRLQAPKGMEAVFLGSYFLAAAVSIPAWLAVVKRWGLARTWAVGMGLSVLVFAWVLRLETGDFTAFVLVCLLSGLALGADLVLPAALLNGVIAELGEQGRSEGVYVGWWNMAAKLNLALAAGVTLPLLAFLGYRPGQQDPTALWALTWVYGAVPCVFKIIALGLLVQLWIRRSSS
jgi:glycoside/pentoside/hexuronide:cation symporter, GPH family